MNPRLIFASSSLGFLSGMLVGWSAFRRQAEKEYAELLEEFHKVRQEKWGLERELSMYQHPSNGRNPLKPEEDPKMSLVSQTELEDLNKVNVKKAFEDFRGVLGTTGYSDFDRTVNDFVEGEEPKGVIQEPAVVEPNWEKVEGRPYIISFDDFIDGDDYEKVSLNFYAGDNALADEQEVLIQDIDGTVGSANLNHFGESDPRDPKLLYVRCDRIDVDYEIYREEGSYSQIVLGLGEEFLGDRPEKMRPKKMRRDE